MASKSPPAPDDDTARQWRTVYDECCNGLRVFLRGRLGQEADVEDCLQAVYIKLMKQDSSVPLGARKAWLFRVAANEAALYWRRKSAADRVLENQATDGNPIMTNSLASDDSLERLITVETAQQVRDILNKLPESTQQIVLLRIEDDLTFQEIANRLNIPLGTALTRMRRALEKIKNEIEDSES
ncbi:RNA polymerase sigma factor [Planctomycetes bacterium K23_9]|uniref:ECF RNA polymerase sigma factor SigW n=1 Tax=Stieleria marina TaxID=1930275 RepID=A0A517NNQ7_9BACT|nr:ECF RNA polymerase sigma factor SigW [Planctomycetes bacterium K23_9]